MSCITIYYNMKRALTTCLLVYRTHLMSLTCISRDVKGDVLLRNRYTCMCIHRQ